MGLPWLIGRDLKTRDLIDIDEVARCSGLYVLGKPGMGKTNLLLGLMRDNSFYGNGLFFIDAHGDAIRDLLSRGEQATNYYILDPEDEEYSFGINLISCRDVNSFRERNATYDRARWVFYKIFKSDFGERPWLELIIINPPTGFHRKPGVYSRRCAIVFDGRSFSSVFVR